MTETTFQPPPPLPPPSPPPRGTPRLVRDPDDAVVAGVCAAFGRYTDTDPVLWRVTVAVLTLFGGAGLVLYGLGWLLVPRLGESESFAERTLRRPDRGLSAPGVLLVIVAAVVLLAVLDDGPGFGALLVLAGVGYLVFRERRDPRPPPPAPAGGPPSTGAGVPWTAGGPAPHAAGPDAPTSPFPATPGSDPVPSPPATPAAGPDPATAPFLAAGSDPGTASSAPADDLDPTSAPPSGAASDATAAFPAAGAGSYDPVAAFPAAPPYGSPLPWDVPPPTARSQRVRRPRSPLGALALSAATLLAGVLMALRLSGVDTLTPERILAAALLVVGAGVLMGAWVGRARWLIPVGLVLALALGATSAARGAGLDGGMGQPTWLATSGTQDYRLGAGDGVLDLTALEPGQRADIDVRVGFGRLTVLVPDGLAVRVDAALGTGEVTEQDVDGRRVLLNPDDDTDVEELVRSGAGEPQVDVDAEVGMGEVEVRHVQP